MEVDPDELPSLESILRDLDRLDYEDAKAAGKGRSKAAGLVVVESNPQLRRCSGHTCRARVDPGPKAAATRRGKVFAGLFRDEDSYGYGDEAAAGKGPSPGLQSQVKAELDSDETHDLKSRPAACAAPNRLSLKLGDVARLEGLEGYRSKLNGQPCKVEGLDHESKTCFVRLLGGFLETVSLENVLPESDPIDFHNATAPRGKKNIDGVDVTEVHPRKGETFLHLLCQCRPFSAETAAIFKELAEAMPFALFTKVNMAGQSFLAFATATQHFWVLRHVTLRYPEQMKALICSREAPLRFLMQKMPTPSPPSIIPARCQIPEHVAISTLLSPDVSGCVPFADVAFDVFTGEESFSRFLAHRVVVASQSSVLLQELRKAPLQDLPQEGIRASVFKVDRRISKEVWRNVLQFLYTGVVQCPFAKDQAKMVELLRACAMYKLPKALLDLAQTALFQQLPSSPMAPSLALEIFSITCGSSGEGLDLKSLRDASMMILLGCASEIFAQMTSEKLSAVMDKLLALTEEAILGARPTQVT